MFLVAKTPTLLNSNLPEAEAASSPESGAARCRTSRQKRRFPHRVLTNGHGVRHPHARGGGGYGLVFDRINRINRIEGDGRNAEGAKKGIP